jgi:hypothetical protein
MDWFKNNPFLGLLTLVTAVLLLGAAYFLYDAHSRYQNEVTLHEEQKLSLGRLQGNKPFPSEENVRLAQEELDGARATLAEIGESFEVEIPATTPQVFQDLLRDKVNDITSRAAANGVTLGEGFYLGFEAYETQPPAAAAAGPLALQLQSIHALAGILVDAKVREIAAITRQPLAAEANAAPAEDESQDARRPRKGRDEESPASTKDLPDLVLAPFDVRFTAEQSAFRTAFNRILESKPPVFVRLVGVTNSAPTGPAKAAAAGEEVETGVIKPVLGQEMAIVHLRLAAVSAGARKTD